MAEDVPFLRDQVQRLTAALRKYQEKYPSPSTSLKTTDAGDNTLQPWQTDHSLMSPLLLEYDNTIQELNQQLNNNQKEIQDIRQQVDDLLGENSRLRGELRDNVESLLMHIEGETDHVRDKISDEQLLHNLQHQAQVASQEKDHAVEMWKASMAEIDRLQSQLQEEKDSHSWRVVEKQANQVKEQYYSTVTALNTELNSLQTELRQARSELTKAKMTLTDHEKTIDDLQQQLLWKDQEISDAVMKEGFVDTRVLQLKKALDDLTQKCSQLTQELSRTKAEKSTYEAKASELQKRNDDLEQRELESISQVRESVQIVENAILEKDQAEVLVHQKEEEIEQLQSTITKLINEAGVQSRRQVDIVRKQCNDSIEKLMQELHSMEMDNAEKQAQLDRALREKRTAESELEKIYKEGLVQGGKDRDSYEDISRRAIVAERARDETLMKCEALEQAMKLDQMNNKQEQLQLSTQLSQMQQRLKQLGEETESLNEDRLRYLHDIDELKNKLLGAQQERDAAVRKCNKEVSLIEQDQLLQMRELEAKVQTTEDANRHSQAEMRKLLSAQQRMTARWKEECNTIAQKLEAKLNEYKTELSRCKKRNEELTSLIKESQVKTFEAERTIVEYSHKIRRLEDRVRDTEFRASQTSKQVSWPDKLTGRSRSNWISLT
ncbi:sodium channel and clathrin linker 1-like isoform X2 [Liolophura sinensis]|uniref:sodium channel and clathrin linker 1-like isoform X2 n=1 Tax=Liolophura sinensis TaxID=3198878 RepID=UPI0031589A64